MKYRFSLNTNLRNFAEWLSAVVSLEGKWCRYRAGYLQLEPAFPNKKIRDGEIENAVLEVRGLYQMPGDLGSIDTKPLPSLITFDAQTGPDGFTVTADCPDSDPGLQTKFFTILHQIDVHFPEAHLSDLLKKRTGRRRGCDPRLVPRNKLIFTESQAGMSRSELAKKHNLSQESIKHIVKDGKLGLFED